MTRLELGIVSLFCATIVMLASTVWSTLELPQRLKADHDHNTAKLLAEVTKNQDLILQKLEER